MAAGLTQGHEGFPALFSLKSGGVRQSGKRTP
jgi:hypothetical protein